MEQLRPSQPSAWVRRWIERRPDRPPVLDLACGAGRHARWLAQAGHRVVGVDRDPAALAALAGAGVQRIRADLEAEPWILRPRSWAGVVLVTNYLWRPRFEELLSTVAPGGFLIYETFMAGHERFGRPKRADFLLRENELLDRVGSAAGWRVIGFEQGAVDAAGLWTDAAPRAVIQRLFARLDPAVE